MDTRISLHKLDVFCRVVECGTVTRAAGEFGVAQPVITGHLRTLEERLGVRVFERRGRTLGLTEAGEAAYAWASEVIAATRSAAPIIDGFAGVSRAGISIAACSISAGSVMPDVILRFSKQEPDAVITVRALTTETALQSVADRTSDLGIVSYAQDAACPASVSLERLRDEEIVLVAGPGAAGPDRLGADELDALPYVCTPAGSARRRSLDRQLAELGAGPRHVVLELGHGEAIRLAVGHGLGVALMARSSVAADLHSGVLREIGLPGVALRCEIALATRHDHRFTALQRRLLAAVRASGR